MRVMVFFDLPVETSDDRRAYARFRKMLIRNGFIMMQESVYSKLALNTSIAASVMNMIRREKPPKGLIQMMLVTEKQYEKIEYVIGAPQTGVIDTSERVVFL